MSSGTRHPEVRGQLDDAHSASLSATLGPAQKGDSCIFSWVGSFHWSGTFQFNTIPFFCSLLHRDRLNWTLPTIMNVFTLLSSSCHLRISLRIILGQNDI